MSFWSNVANSFVDGAIDLGASLLSSSSASNAANDAAAVQRQAADNSAKVQQNIYDQTRADQAPFRDVGENSLYQLASLFGVEYEGAPGTIEERMDTAMARFVNSPDYQFRLDEGINALDRSASSRGRLRSGAQDQAVQEFGQNLASSQFTDYQNRLSSLAGVGQVANQTLASAGQAAGQGIANAHLNAGAATASGIVGQNNALQGGIDNFLKGWRS